MVNTNPHVPRTVFITVYVARDLAKTYHTKDELEDALIATARRPLALRAYAHYWANTGSQQFRRRSFGEHCDMLAKNEAEQAARTPVPEWLKPLTSDDEMMTVATMKKGETALLVVGDASRNKVQVVPGGDYVTTEIRLPKNWNELVAPLGYEPIETFYLEADFAVPEKSAKPARKKQAGLSDRPQRPQRPATPSRPKK